MRSRLMVKGDLRVGMRVHVTNFLNADIITIAADDTYYNSIEIKYDGGETAYVDTSQLQHPGGILRTEYGQSIGIRRTPAYPGQRTGDVVSGDEMLDFVDMKVTHYQRSVIEFYELADGRGWIHDFNSSNPLIKAIHVIKRGGPINSTFQHKEPSIDLDMSMGYIDTIPMTLEEVREVARSRGLHEIYYSANNRVVSFSSGDDNKDSSSLINVFWTTGTVAMRINCPFRGYTQIFREDVDMIQLQRIFLNLCVETETGYDKRNRRLNGEKFLYPKSEEEEIRRHLALLDEEFSQREQERKTFADLLNQFEERRQQEAQWIAEEKAREQEKLQKIAKEKAEKEAKQKREQTAREAQKKFEKKFEKFGNISCITTVGMDALTDSWSFSSGLLDYLVVE